MNSPKDTPSIFKTAAKKVEQLQNQILREVREIANNSMRRNPFIDQYTQGMGTAFFTVTLDGESLKVPILSDNHLQEIENHFNTDDVAPPDKKLLYQLESLERDCHLLSLYYRNWSEIFAGSLTGFPMDINRHKLARPTNWL